MCSLEYCVIFYWKRIEDGYSKPFVSQCRLSCSQGITIIIITTTAITRARRVSYLLLKLLRHRNSNQFLYACYDSLPRSVAYYCLRSYPSPERREFSHFVGREKYFSKTGGTAMSFVLHRECVVPLLHFAPHFYSKKPKKPRQKHLAAKTYVLAENSN